MTQPKLPPRYLLRRILEAGKLLDTGCIEFNNGVDNTGYSRIQGRKAHRAIWEWLFGELPDHIQIDHLCRNTMCINPEHLEPVTARENSLRSAGITAVCAAVDRCPQGHLYSGANLVGAGTTHPWRACRICKSARQMINRKRFIPRIVGKVRAALQEHVDREENRHLTLEAAYFNATNALREKAQAARSSGKGE